MAKETKKPENEAKNLPEMTEENVMENIKNGNLLKDENVQKALDDIKKREDEQQVREATNMIMCAKYINTKELINLRARRREDRITKETLKKCTDLLNEVLDGKVTPVEYKDKKSEILKDKEKKFRESSDKYDEEMRELRNSLTGEYRYMAEWDRY